VRCGEWCEPMGGERRCGLRGSVRVIKRPYLGGAAAPPPPPPPAALHRPSNKPKSGPGVLWRAVHCCRRCCPGQHRCRGLAACSLDSSSPKKGRALALARLVALAPDWLLAVAWAVPVVRRVVPERKARVLRLMSAWSKWLSLPPTASNSLIMPPPCFSSSFAKPTHPFLTTATSHPARNTQEGALSLPAQDGPSSAAPQQPP